MDKRFIRKALELIVNNKKLKKRKITARCCEAELFVGVRRLFHSRIFLGRKLLWWWSWRDRGTDAAWVPLILTTASGKRSMIVRQRYNPNMADITDSQLYNLYTLTIGNIRNSSPSQRSPSCPFPPQMRAHMPNELYMYINALNARTLQTSIFRWCGVAFCAESPEEPECTPRLACVIWATAGNVEWRHRDESACTMCRGRSGETLHNQCAHDTSRN